MYVHYIVHPPVSLFPLLLSVKMKGLSDLLFIVIYYYLLFFLYIVSAVYLSFDTILSIVGVRERTDIVFVFFHEFTPIFPCKCNDRKSFCFYVFI